MERKGLYMATEWDYDVIVLDVMMPKLDGWQVLGKLRERKLTPVLMLTARDSTDDRVRGLDGGTDDYLIKPFQIDELLARVRVLLKRGSAHHAPTIDVRGVEIDTSARLVRLRGKPVELVEPEKLIPFDNKSTNAA